jgi:predicted transcriptional regulator
MDQDLPDVTDAELAVLRSLWDQEAVTIREMVDIIYPKGTASHYATVQKLLERLEQKQCVRRDRRVWPHVYEATIDREELIARRLRQVAEQLCGGSLAPLRRCLLRIDRLSNKERDELRALLEPADGKANRQG